MIGRICGFSSIIMIFCLVAMQHSNGCCSVKARRLAGKKGETHWLVFPTGFLEVVHLGENKLLGAEMNRLLPLLPRRKVSR